MHSALLIFLLFHFILSNPNFRIFGSHILKNISGRYVIRRQAKCHDKNMAIQSSKVKWTGTSCCVKHEAFRWLIKFGRLCRLAWPHCWEMTASQKLIRIQRDYNYRLAINASMKLSRQQIEGLWFECGKR